MLRRTYMVQDVRFLLSHRAKTCHPSLALLVSCSKLSCLLPRLTYSVVRAILEPGKYADPVFFRNPCARVAALVADVHDTTEGEGARSRARVHPHTHIPVLRTPSSAYREVRRKKGSLRSLVFRDERSNFIVNQVYISS